MTMNLNCVTCSTVVVDVGDWYPSETHLIHGPLTLGGGPKHIAHVLRDDTVNTR